MTIDSDDMISLPVPPLPRPAARRTAIDAALRKFDGIEEAPASKVRRPPSLVQWASTHRRPLSALVTTALVAVISIPAIQVALRDHPIEVTSEDRQPNPIQPGADAIQEEPAFEGPAAVQTIANEPAPPAQSRTAAPAAAENRSGFAAVQRDEKAGPVAPAPLAIAPAEPPMVAAPPPPPPAPPPPAPEMKAQDSAAGNIIVTGSRVRRQNLESAMPVTVVGDAYADFLSHLQAGLEANDRRAVIRLIGLPLRVTWNGDTRTYRTAKDVERDYDRIFSPSVRQSLIEQQSDTLTKRDGGRLMGNGRIWFGCGLRSCSSDATVRIWEVNP